MTEAGMRSTENVRGEWDELGERDVRVVAPGPGPDDSAAGTPGGVQPEEDDARAGAPPVTEAVPSGALPPAAAEGSGPAPAPVPEQMPDAPEPDWGFGAAPGEAGIAAIDVEDIPADLGPALDAVAGVGRASGGGAPLDLGSALDLAPAPDDESAPKTKPRWGPGPVGEPPPVAGPVADDSPGRPKPRWGAGPVGEPRPAWGVQPSSDPARGAEPVGDGAEVVVAVEAVPDAAPVAGLVPGPSADETAAVPGPLLDRDLAVEPVSGPDTVALVTVPKAEAMPGSRYSGPDSPDFWESFADADRLPEEVGPLPGDPAGLPGSTASPSVDTAVLPQVTDPLSGDPAPLPEGAARYRDEVRAPVTMTVGAADPVAWWGAGRRHPVISTETTAPIPVHLLFRDDDHGGPAATGVTQRPGVRRPPMPRSPQMRRSGRPAPLADPRLAERPGPALPGWAALLTAAAATAACLAVLWWHGVLPAGVEGRLGIGARVYDGMGTGAWALIALLVSVVLFALGGLGRGRVGYASVLTLFGDYRGSVRRTGLLWISPLLLRRRVDVRLRHWRSEPLPAVDASGTALRVVVLVVWRVKDTVRAALGVADHECYLRDQVEAALARVLSQLPADAFHEDTRTLRDAEAVGDALTRVLKADCEPVGIEVYSAQPTGIEYAPEVAAAMQRCRVAAIDAKHRDGVLTSVVDAVDDTVGRLTARGIVELDAYEHKALVRDLTVAFYTGRSGGEGA